MSKTAGLQSRDVSYQLAENIASCTFEDLTADTIETTKRTILDTIGVIIGGSGAGAGIENVVQMVKAGGGTEESTVYGHNIKTNCWMAAFANGAMAHSLDYDNVHDDAFTHPSTSTVPAALAVAEKVGGVSGKEMITAMALGDDLHCRLAYSLSKPRDPATLGSWMFPLVLGGFASASVASRLLGLSAERIVDAFGIMLNRTGGPLEIIHDPGPLRGLYASFTSFSGVFSAMMAYYGIPGIKACFEGQAGFFNAYVKGSYDRSALTGDLGKRFEGAGVSFKPWPSCRFTHPYVDATLQIVKEHDILPENIVEIIAGYESENVKKCLVPAEIRQNPGSSPEAKISLPFTIAMAVAFRKIEIGDFSNENIASPFLLQLAKKVTPKFDASLKTNSMTMLPALVEIKTENGRVYSKRVDLVYGHPENPMSWEDLVLKFKDCLSYSAKSIPEKNISQAVEQIMDLEKCQDVNEVIHLLS